MKNLLSVLAVSTLVGTSASNLKPVFTNTNINYGFKSNQINNKTISIKNKNSSNPFINAVINDIKTKIVKIAPNGTIWVGTEKGLYKSTDGITFEQVKGFNYVIYDIAFSPDGTIWISASGIYKSTDGINFSKIPGDVNGLKFKITADGTIWLSNTIYHCLWKSTDGINFSKITFTSSFKIYATKYFTVSPDGTVYVVWQEFDDTLHFCKSTDGTNFKDIFGINRTINDINFSSDDTVYVASTGGLYKTTDGTNFTKILLNDSFWNVKIAPNGTIWVGGLTSVYKSTDGTNFLNVSKDGNFVENLKFGLDGTIYSCNTLEILKSTDGTNFTKIGNFGHEGIFSIDVAKDGTVYFGTKGGLLKPGKLYKIDIINSLLTINKADYIGDKYNGFVYKNDQKIAIKNDYLNIAVLDNKIITIPTTDLDIPVGEHTLILTLKDKYKIFSGNKTGTISFKFLIKNLINELDYNTNINDTQLYTGLVSKYGNTNDAYIIQTKIKDGSTHPANINIDIKDSLIDFDVNKSFYEQGTVDSSNNFFEDKKKTKQPVTKNFSITSDGIYHLHLVDTVGNTYDSYLELGEINWKLTGTFDDKILTELANKLNVTVNESNPIKKTEAMGWLQNYKIEADKQFRNIVQTNGKGFDISIDNDLNGDYKLFLDPINYVDNKTQYAINQTKLNDKINKIAEQKLQDGLIGLPKNLNINTSNVVNKSTLDSYSIWIKGYDIFINNNKDQWINDVVKVASRGFATEEQKQQIVSHICSLDFKNYLEETTWTPNLLLNSFNDNKYLKYIKLEKLKSDTIDWVNTNMKEINIAYQNAINGAESGLNLHGYSIDKILNGRPKPQTKSEIDNFADGQSYHEWLQNQANMKFKIYQLAMGFGIGIPLLLVVIAIAWVIRSRTNPKYNGVARARKELRQERKKLKKQKT